MLRNWLPPTHLFVASGTPLPAMSRKRETRMNLWTSDSSMWCSLSCCQSFLDLRPQASGMTRFKKAPFVSSLPVVSYLLQCRRWWLGQGRYPAHGASPTETWFRKRPSGHYLSWRARTLVFQRFSPSFRVVRKHYSKRGLLCNDLPTFGLLSFLVRTKQALVCGLTRSFTVCVPCYQNTSAWFLTWNTIFRPQRWTHR